MLHQFEYELLNRYLQSLHQCAETLGVEPVFLLNKGIQAVLRMVARNGNKLSFPLEVQQLD